MSFDEKIQKAISETKSEYRYNYNIFETPDFSSMSVCDGFSEQEKAEKGYTLPEYVFTVECGGATSGESGQLDVMGMG